MTRSILVLLGVGVVSSFALAKEPPPAPATDELASRLATIASRAEHARADVPRFAFTSNVTWEAPATLDEAGFGLPDHAVPDRTKTLIGLVDPDTAFISTHLAEVSACPKAGCASATPEGWLRATAAFERTGGIWQPIAWSITSPIPGASQIAAMDEGVGPDKLARSTAGADDVARLFETTIAVPKAFAATVSLRKEAVLFGSELSERWTGAQVKAKLLSWNFMFRVRDGLRAGVSRSGNLAWVAANVDGVSLKRPKAKPVPYRLFALYEKVGADWLLVGLQFSTSV